jgi:hypothetical protein
MCKDAMRIRASGPPGEPVEVNDKGCGCVVTSCMPSIMVGLLSRLVVPLWPALIYCANVYSHGARRAERGVRS